ncbi:MAG TPA: CopG family transcriptional regulator [Arcobacter sp.]|nr:CopG family transcriptional regulator [Arcobacter sp.]
MVSVRLDTNVESQLNHFATQQHISKSKVIKDSLIYYFDMLNKKEIKQTPYELGSALFGKYSSGEENLSVTYKQKLKDKINAKNDNR